MSFLDLLALDTLVDTLIANGHMTDGGTRDDKDRALWDRVNDVRRLIIGDDPGAFWEQADSQSDTATGRIRRRVKP